jgi:hypothetical protein
MAESIDRRLEAAPDGMVTVSNTSGSVEVTGWSRNEVEVTGKLGRAKSISGDEFDFLASVTTGTPKLTLPSPPTMHFWAGSDAVRQAGYDIDGFCADLAEIYRQEIADLGGDRPHFAQEGRGTPHEDAAVPKMPLVDVAVCRLDVGLFVERTDSKGLYAGARDEWLTGLDVSVTCLRTARQDRNRE